VKGFAACRSALPDCVAGRAENIRRDRRGKSEGLWRLDRLFARRSRRGMTMSFNQLCVEGLKLGEHYKIVLREGLPSTVNEALLKSADYEIYVRDRSPLVHFTGKNYVLPPPVRKAFPSSPSTR
jgi:uncharacterized protein YfaS (alpha-2-macroglobulin family)